VEYFVYGRDNPNADALLEELAEAHWSFMDGYADVMIARGPTLTPDRSTHTGSLHIVDLPDEDAARTFALDEPYYRGGVYRDVLIRRWRNDLGRTMWDFQSDAPKDPRFLSIGLGRPGARPSGALEEEHRRFLVEGEYEDRTILRGPLLSARRRGLGRERDARRACRPRCDRGDGDCRALRVGRVVLEPRDPRLAVRGSALARLLRKGRVSDEPTGS
jgi:uncharacterized protein